MAAEKKEGIERFIKGALARAPASEVNKEGKVNDGVTAVNDGVTAMSNEVNTMNNEVTAMNNEMTMMDKDATTNKEATTMDSMATTTDQTHPTNEPPANPFTIPRGFQSFHVAPIHGLFETPKSYSFSQAPETEEVETVDDDRFAFSLTEATHLQETAVAQVAAAAKEAQEREERRRREEKEREEREKKEAAEREAREKEERKKKEEERKKEEAAREARRKREEAMEREAAKRREEERHREAVKRQCQEIQSATTTLLERMEAWQRRVETSLTRQTERVAALHERVDAETACWRVLVAMGERCHVQREVSELAAQRQRRRLREAAKRRRIQESVARCCVDGHIADGVPRPRFHLSTTKLPSVSPSPRALAAELAAVLEKRGMRVEIVEKDATVSLTVSSGVSTAHVIITQASLPGDAGWWDAARMAKWARETARSLTQPAPPQVIGVLERSGTARRLLEALKEAAPATRAVEATLETLETLERCVEETLERKPSEPALRAGELLRRSLVIAGGARLSAEEAEEVAEKVRRRVTLPPVEAGSGAEMLLRCEGEEMDV